MFLISLISCLINNNGCLVIKKRIFKNMTTLQFQNSLTGLQSKMFFFALSLTSNTDKANDLVQETYLKALTYQNKFSSETNLMAWIYTIMKNTFINEYRRNVKARSTIETQSDKLHISFSKDDFYPSVDSIHSAKEIQKKITMLEEELREPFELFLNGYKYKEIAEKLDLPLGTIKSRIFFTRKKLSACLIDYLN